LAKKRKSFWKKPIIFIVGGWRNGFPAPHQTNANNFETKCVQILISIVLICTNYVLNIGKKKLTKIQFGGAGEMHVR
jgi:hypothetical protein